MKALLSVFFSLTLWFGQVALPVAYADEAPATEATPQVVQQPAPSSSGGVDRRYTHPEEFTDKKEEEKKKGKGLFGYSGLTMTNLTLFATVGGSVAITVSCWDQTSAKIFVGATALFAAMEVMNWVNYKKASDRELKVYQNEDKNKQVQSLEAAAQQTEEAAKTAKQRAMLAQTAAAGMIAAGAFALYEALQADAACAASVASGGAACTPATRLDFCKGKLFGHNPIELDPLHGILALSQNNLMLNHLQNSKSNLDTYFINKEMEGYFSGEVQSPSIVDYENMEKYKSQYEFDMDKEDLALTLTDVYKGMRDFVIPSAQAQGQISSIVSGAAGGVLAGMMSASTQSFDKLKGGYVRAAGFAAAGAMAFGAGMQINNAAKQMQSRANEYRKLAQTMQTKFENTGALTNRSTQQPIDATRIGTIEANNNSQDGSVCFTGDKPGDLKEDIGCSCRSNNSCKKSEVPKVDHQAFSGAGLIANTAGLIGQTGNSLYSGNTTAATTSAAKGAQMAARVNRLKKSLQDYANLKKKERGEKPIDFAGLEKQTQKNLINGINDAFNKLSDSERATLAQVAPTLGSEAGMSVGESKPVEFKENENYDKNNVASNAVSGTATGNETLDFKFDLDEKGEELTALDPSLLEGSETGSLNASSSDYENPEGSDISPAHESLWNIIHRRYLKNYDRFFARKKTEF